MAIRATVVVFKLKAEGNAPKVTSRVQKNINEIKKKTKRLKVFDKSAVKNIDDVNSKIGRVKRSVQDTTKKVKDLSKALKESRVGRGFSAVGQGAGRGVSAIGRGVGLPSVGGIGGLAGVGGIAGAIGSLIAAPILGKVATYQAGANYRGRVEGASQRVLQNETAVQRASVFNISPSSIKSLGSVVGKTTALNISTSIRSSYGNISAEAEQKLRQFQQRNIGSTVASGGIRERAGNDILKNVYADIIEGFQGDYVAQSLGLADPFIKAFDLGGAQGTSRATRIAGLKENADLNIAQSTLNQKGVLSNYTQSLNESIKVMKVLTEVMREASNINNNFTVKKIGEAIRKGALLSF